MKAEILSSIILVLRVVDSWAVVVKVAIICCCCRCSWSVVVVVVVQLLIAGLLLLLSLVSCWVIGSFVVRSLLRHWFVDLISGSLFGSGRWCICN